MKTSAKTSASSQANKMFHVRLTLDSRNSTKYMIKMDGDVSTLFVSNNLLFKCWKRRQAAKALRRPSYLQEVAQFRIDFA